MNIEQQAVNEKQLRIFISYHRADESARQLAKTITKYFQGEDYSVYDSVDLHYFTSVSVSGYRDYEPDPVMWRELSAELGQANCVLVLFTPDALTSSQVDAEYRYAKFWSAHRKLELVPVAVGDMQLPFHYSNAHQLSISDGFDAHDRIVLFERLRAVLDLLIEDQPLETEERVEVSDPFTPQELLTRRVVSLMRRFKGQQLSGEVVQVLFHQPPLWAKRFPSRKVLDQLPYFAPQQIRRDVLWGDLRCDIWAEASESVWAVKTLMSRPTRLADYVASSIISRHGWVESRSATEYDVLRSKSLVFWLVFGEDEAVITRQDLIDVDREISYRVERLEPREQLPQILCLSTQRELRALDGFLRNQPQEG